MLKRKFKPILIGLVFVAFVIGAVVGAVVFGGVHGDIFLLQLSSFIQQVFVGLAQKLFILLHLSVDDSNDTNVQPHGGIHPVLLHSVIAPL